MSKLLTDEHRHKIYIGIIGFGILALQTHPIIQAIYCAIALPLWWRAKGRPIF